MVATVDLYRSYKGHFAEEDESVLVVDSSTFNLASVSSKTDHCHHVRKMYP